MSAEDQNKRANTDRNIASSSMFPFNVEEYDGRRGRSLERYLERTGLALDDLLAANLILDLGAGPEARFRDELTAEAKRLNMTHTPQVISLSLGYADPAIRENLLERTGSAEGVIAADAEHLPFPDGMFPRIIALHVLTHIREEKLEAVVDELERVLAPNGVLVIAPLLAPKERRDYTFKPDEVTAEGLRVQALKDRWVAHSMRLSGLLSQKFSRPADKIMSNDLPPEPGSEVQLYKLRRVTIEKGV